MEKKVLDPTRILKPCQQENCDGYYLSSKRNDDEHSATITKPDIPCQKCLERKMEAKKPPIDFFVMPSMVEPAREMAVIRE